MKKLLLVTAFSLMASSAFANEPANATETAIPSAVTSKIPKLATLAEGDLADGDLVMISRGFGNWALRCEWLLSASKRVCGIEQRTFDEKSDVSWRVAQTVDDKPVLLITVPKHFDVSKGMRLSFSGLEKTLPASQWQCNGKLCVTSFEFEGFIQAAITNSSEVGFSYSIRGDDGKTNDITLVGPMDGFKRALNAASVDPFGREALASAQEAKEATKEKAAVKTSEAKPVARPLREKAKPKIQQQAKTAPDKKASGLF
jgi:hypothetical protein